MQGAGRGINASETEGGGGDETAQSVKKKRGKFCYFFSFLGKSIAIMLTSFVRSWTGRGVAPVKISSLHAGVGIVRYNPIDMSTSGS